MQGSDMKKIRGIIFDLDGVLCFTDRLHYEAWKEVCNRYGFAFSKEDNDLLRGVSRMDCVDIITSRQQSVPSDFDRERFAFEKNELYRAGLKTLTDADLAPDIKKTLSVLRKKGLKLAVGSSSKNAGTILDQLKLREYFDAVVDGNDISRSKPNPEVFIRAAERLSLRSDECIVVEDAAAGAEAGLNDGFYVAAINDARSTDGVTWKIDSARDLLNLDIFNEE